MELTTQPKDFDKAVFELGKKIQPHTIQLLQKSSKEHQHSPCGTGVLVQIGSNFFLFTASHVVRDMYDKGKELFVSTEQGVIPLKGRRDRTDLEKDKHTDLAYFFLDKEFAQLLTKTYQFLPSSKMGDLVPDVPATQYLIVGYPTVNIEVDSEKHIVTTGAQMYLTSPAKEDIYNNAGLDLLKHYLFHYGEHMTDILTGKPVLSLPEQEGISGCGVWFISATKQKGRIEYDYGLVGIIKGSKVYFLQGTKIGVLVRDLIIMEGL